MKKEDLLIEKTALIQMLEVYEGNVSQSNYAAIRTREAKEQLEEIETKLSKDRAEYDGYYYYLRIDTSTGTVHVVEETELLTSTDNRFYGAGNYYLTQEKAQKRAEQINLEFKIEKWLRENDPDFDPDWGYGTERKYTFSYDRGDDALLIDCYRYYQTQGHLFSSVEIIEKFIREMGDEVKRVMFEA